MYGWLATVIDGYRLGLCPLPLRSFYNLTIKRWEKFFD